VKAKSLGEREFLVFEKGECEFFVFEKRERGFLFEGEFFVCERNL
jgi:hypothetical protein